MYISNCLTASPATVPGSGGYLGCRLGRLGSILAPSKGVWGPFWLQVAGSGGHLGSKLGVWCHLGSKLEGPGGILAPGWGVGGPSWSQEQK